MKRKVDSPVEYFSGVRTQHAMERADVVFLVIDAVDGVTKQDQSLAGEVLDAGKALVVVVNKWDLIIERWEEEPIPGYKNLKHFLTKYEESLRKQMFFLPDPPVLFVSAMTGFRIESLLETAAAVQATLDMKLPTGRLNNLIQNSSKRARQSSSAPSASKSSTPYKQAPPHTHPILLQPRRASRPRLPKLPRKSTRPRVSSALISSLRSRTRRRRRGRGRRTQAKR